MQRDHNAGARGVGLHGTGLSCGVDDATNAMLPAPLRSTRADSLLRFMRVESTGVASFTLFAPLGPGAGLTAFHQETKQRRSFNCGTGDFIVQPLTVASHIRQYDGLPLCASHPMPDSDGGETPPRSCGGE